MTGTAIKIICDRAVNDDHAALLIIGGGMGEIRTISYPDNKPDMCGVTVGIIGGYGADVTTAQIVFSSAGLGLRDMIDGQG